MESEPSKRFIGSNGARLKECKEMKKQESNWAKALAAVEYFFGSFFIGATSILVVEGMSDWYTDSLKGAPLWRWWLTSIITGAIVIVIWRFVIKTASEMDRSKKE